MTTHIPVYGTQGEVSGLIVEVNLDQSGFQVSDFDEDNPYSMPFSLVIEVARTPQSQLSYVATQNQTICDESRKATGALPVVRGGNRVETQTVVLQHDVLGSAEILDREAAAECAVEEFDMDAPVKRLWRDIRGRTLDVDGVEFDGKLIAACAELGDNLPESPSPSAVDLAEDAVEYLHEEFVSHRGDEWWTYNTEVRAAENTILSPHFEVAGNHPETETHTRGRLFLTRRGEWIVDDVSEQTVDKTARAYERHHERV